VIRKTRKAPTRNRKVARRAGEQNVARGLLSSVGVYSVFSESNEGITGSKRAKYIEDGGNRATKFWTHVHKLG
jgi:hypothetical protein